MMRTYHRARQFTRRNHTPKGIQVVGFALAILTYAYSTPATAQQADIPTFRWSFATRMYQAVNRVVKVAQKQKDIGFNFTRIGCFYGALLPKQQSVSETIQLKAGVTYAFIASGEDGVKDVELSLRHADTDLLVKNDNTVSRTSVIAYKCPLDGRFRIQMSLYAADTDFAMCSLAILQRGDSDHAVIFNGDTLQSTLQRCLTRCGDAAAGHPSRFHFGESTWALVGIVVGNGGDIVQDPKQFEAGHHTFVGAASDESICDFFALKESETKNYVGACIMDTTDNTADSLFKTFLFKTVTEGKSYIVEQGQHYRKGRENAGDPGLSLIVTAVLDQPQDGER
jgi:hypothetical protein